MAAYDSRGILAGCARAAVGFVLAMVLPYGCHDGPECSVDADCGESKICNDSYEHARCVFPGVEGKRCAEHEDCLLTLVCYGEYTYSHEDVCLTPGFYGYPCQQDHNCAESFKCSLGQSPHCISIKHEGDLCTSDYQCIGELSCIGGYCNESDVWSGTE